MFKEIFKRLVKIWIQEVFYIKLLESVVCMLDLRFQKFSPNLKVLESTESVNHLKTCAIISLHPIKGLLKY